MKVTELRIGNIISYRFADGKNPVKVHWKDLKEFDIKPQELIGKIYFPIPLTEEWISKDYEKTTNNWKGNGADYQPETSKTVQNIYKLTDDIKIIFQTWSYRNTEKDIWINEDSIFIMYGDDSMDLYKNEVHVLQNLIFALTGKEL
jgi:hypothetical protein